MVNTLFLIQIVILQKMNYPRKNREASYILLALTKLLRKNLDDLNRFRMEALFLISSTWVTLFFENLKSTLKSPKVH